MHAPSRPGFYTEKITKHDALPGFMVNFPGNRLSLHRMLKDYFLPSLPEQVPLHTDH